MDVFLRRQAVAGFETCGIYPVNRKAIKPHQIQANTTFIKTIQARAAANQPDDQVVNDDDDEEDEEGDNSLVPDQFLDVETIAANITPELESDSEPVKVGKSAIYVN